MSSSNGQPVAQTSPGHFGALPLFPLKLVLLPDALLHLQVFETRYLDLMANCMRSGEPFGVICLRQGAEVGPAAQGIALEEVGSLAHIEWVDADQASLLRVRCRGGQRFRCKAEPAQRSNGLWTAQVEFLPPDPRRSPGPAVSHAVAALEEAIKAMKAQNHEPFATPYRFDDAGWVANRWCELLPLPLTARQKLMALDDPVIRLSLVDGYLRDKKIIVG